MKATAYLIYGFVGAGKSTFARRLEQDKQAIRFTHDEWIHKLYGANPPCDNFDDCFARVNDLIWEYVSQLLLVKVDVIIDHGFWTRASRDKARARVSELGANSVLYHVDCPEDVMRRRVLKRSQNVPSCSLWINDDAFILFKSRLEALDDDEEHLLINGNTEQADATDG